MAFTEKYVSVAGGGAHDGTSEANAWTLAEALAAPAPAGSRVNVISGSYTLVGGTSAFPTGTIPLPIVFRGYNVTIGDLDNQGWNADGTLNTTNMPDITITTAVQVPGVLCLLQNLDITGALSSYLIGSTTVDDWGLISCRVVNTQNNASAGCVQGDDQLKIINCDMYCSGAAHTAVVDADLEALAYASRFRSTSNAACLAIIGGAAIRNTFHGNSSSVGLKWLVATAASVTHFAVENTGYGIGTVIEIPNTAAGKLDIALGNHATDCTNWLVSLHAATADNPFIECFNRTRDVSTLLTGVISIQAGAVTTDGGDHTTDYEDAPNGDFHLIDGAPGEASGSRGNDIGAYQSVDPAGGGGSDRRSHLNGGLA